jgi:hypothetical protein
MIYKIPTADVASIILDWDKAVWNLELSCGNRAVATVIAADGREFAFSTELPLTCCDKHQGCKIEKEET